MLGDICHAGQYCPKERVLNISVKLDVSMFASVLVTNTFLFEVFMKHV